MNQASTPSARRRDIDRLLQLGADAARDGNRQAARSLFLALAREYPEDTRVWIGLAGVAASRNEQREALERIVALDPSNERARLALERLSASPARSAAAPALEARPLRARTTPVLPETRPAQPAQSVEIVPRDAPIAGRPRDVEDEEEVRRAPFPLLNALAMGLILLLLLALGVVLGRAFLGGPQRGALPTATAVLNVQPGPASTSAGVAQTIAPPPATSVSAADLATAQPAPAPSAAPTDPAAAPTAAPTAIPNVLPLGTIIDYDGWSASLLRPDYALALDGAIGDLQPSGRFVLAVVAVSNNASTPRHLPADMFVLTDSAGRSYLPVPGASSTYLALYQRAQYGDLALEETFDASSGMRSVPIIFDVPPDASGLRLTVSGAGPAGWPVGEPGPNLLPSGP